MVRILFWYKMKDFQVFVTALCITPLKVFEWNEDLFEHKSLNNEIKT